MRWFYPPTATLAISANPKHAVAQEDTFLTNHAEVPPNNGDVLNIAHITKNIMSSATEAELAALYIMAREAVYMRIILDKLGHK